MFRTVLTEVFYIEYPVLLAPMGGCLMVRLV
jgi:hypothetical protein